MSDRRSFIKKAALAGLGLGILPSFKLTDETEPKIGWNNISKMFQIAEGLHYFNTGTMGLSPLFVSNAYKNAIDLTNSSGVYNKHEKEFKSSLASFVNCVENELALTHNVTEGINIAAWSIPLNKGDEVILCTHEHAGNALPWLNRAKVDGLNIKLIELGKNGNETLVNLAGAMSGRTKVIALPHIPCTIGHILPIKDICDFAKSYNCYTCIDGAHGAGMLELDLKKIGCDFYSGCFHKWMLGPKGSGFLYINERLLPKLNSYFVGAHSDEGWDFRNKEVSYDGLKSNSAHRYYYGTQSDAIYAASKASIDFFNELGMKKVEKEIKKRGRLLCSLLEEIEDIELLVSSNKKENSGIISFRPKNKDFKALASALNKATFRVRMVPESGIDCIRVSCHIYNSEQDITAFVSKLRELLKA